MSTQKSSLSIIQQIESHLIDKEEENERLKQDLRRLEADYRHNLNAIEQTNNELDQYVSACETLRQLVLEKDNQLKLLEKQIRDQQFEHRNLQDNYSRLERETKQEIGRITDLLNNEQLQHESTIRCIEENSEADKQTLKRRLSKTEEAMEAMRQQLLLAAESTTRTVQKDAERMVLLYQQEKEQEAKRAKRFEDSFDQSQRNLEQSIQKVQKLNDNILKLEEEKKNIEWRHDDQTAQLLSRISEHESTIALLTNQLTESQTDSATWADRYSREVASAQNQKITMENELRSVKAKDDEIMQLKLDKCSLVTQIEELVRQIETEKQLRKEADKSHRHSQAAISELQSQLVRMDMSCKERDNIIKSYDIELTEQRGIEERLNHKIATLKQQLQITRVSSAAARILVGEHTLAADVMQTNLTRIQAIASRQEQELKDSRQHAAVLQQALSKKDTETAQENTQRENTLRSQIEVMNSVIKENEKGMEILRQENEALQEELDTLIVASQETEERHERETSILKQQIDLSDKTNARLSSEMSALERDNQKMKKQIAQISRSSNSIASHQNTIFDLQTEIALKDEEISRLRSERETMIEITDILTSTLAATPPRYQRLALEQINERKLSMTQSTHYRQSSAAENQRRMKEFEETYQRVSMLINKQNQQIIDAEDDKLIVHSAPPTVTQPHHPQFVRPANPTPQKQSLEQDPLIDNHEEESDEEWNDGRQETWIRAKQAEMDEKNRQRIEQNQLALLNANREANQPHVDEHSSESTISSIQELSSIQNQRAKLQEDASLLAEEFKRQSTSQSRRSQTSHLPSRPKLKERNSDTASLPKNPRKHTQKQNEVPQPDLSVDGSRISLTEKQAPSRRPTTPTKPSPLANSFITSDSETSPETSKPPKQATHPTPSPLNPQTRGSRSNPTHPKKPKERRLTREEEAKLKACSSLL